MQSGTGDWTWCGWVRFDSVAAAQCIASKGDSAGGSREWLFLHNAGGPLQFAVYDASLNANSMTPVTLSANTLYFLVVQHDSAAAKIYVWVNNTKYEASRTVTINTGTGDFRMGAFAETPSYLLGSTNGATLQSCGWTKSLINTTDLGTLYNSGVPLRWSQLASGIQSQFTSFWNLHDDAVTDSAGTNTLTALHAGVTVKTVISQWDDASGNANHLLANNTIAYTNMTPAPAAVNGLDGVAGNGVAGYLKCDGLSSVASGVDKPFTFSCVFKSFDPAGTGDSQSLMSFGKTGNVTPVHDLFLRLASSDYDTDRRDDASSQVTLQGGTTDSSWHYLVLAFDGTSVDVRVDGVSVASGAMNVGTMTVDTYSVYVHRRGGEDGWFYGQSIENGLYNVGLSGGDFTTLETYLASLLSTTAVFNASWAQQSNQ